VAVFGARPTAERDAGVIARWIDRYVAPLLDRCHDAVLGEMLFDQDS
jgi:hypothetical protein